eukprot:TRINITY_DN22645_c0_g1_i1.p1 TRINITY_DN22645_c0_g1~~TRINITY_DN22645_c0_g1_i1.p1  ORF type:complete len:547 (-),score=142.41 TRINITY_DN22645_c0_g1_i1:125-1765(-)
MTALSQEAGNEEENKPNLQRESRFNWSWKDEVKSILKLAAPAFLANLCNFGSSVSNAMFLGHVGEDELAAGALANTWIWATSFLGIGLTFGMDTLVSQAFGSGNYRLVGIIFQNAVVVISIVCVPIAACWFFAEHVLLLFGQVPELAAMSAAYIRIMLPGLPFVLFYRLGLRYLNNQRIIFPSMVSGVCGFTSNVLLNYIFILVLDLRLTGAAVSNLLVFVLQPICLFSYVYFRRLHEKTWHGWSKDAYDIGRLKTYLKFAVPSGLMVILEVWGFEVSTVLAGHFGAASLGAHSVAFSVLLLAFVGPLGISVGTSIRVGNLLGEGKPLEARNVARVGFCIVLCYALLNGSFIAALRMPIAHAFTNNEDVLSIVRTLFLICAVMQFFDGLQTLCGGILRGVGLPTRGTIMNFVGYYLIGVPLGAGLGFGAGLEVYGLWGGIAAGLSVVAIGDVIFLLRIDWFEQSRQAQLRSEKKPEFEQTGDLVLEEMAMNDEEGALLNDVAGPVELTSSVNTDSGSTLIESIRESLQPEPSARELLQPGPSKPNS